MPVVLRPISAGAAEAVRAGRVPDDLQLAADYPTEFSAEVAERVGVGSPLGPFFLHRADDDVVIGEIGGSLVGGRKIRGEPRELLRVLGPVDDLEALLERL